MLELTGLEVRLGDFRLTADLGLEPGVVAVMGPSGGGKSTLLAAIAGFQPVTAGRVLWQGEDLTDRPPGERPVAVLFQDNNLFPHLSVAQNVGLALGPSLKPGAEGAERIAAALARVGLEGRGRDRPGSLSGGQQSRAALARVLLQERAIVLLDEAFSALGPALRAEMLDLTVETLAGEGRLVLMVSHDPEDAARVAPRTLVVAEGEVTGPWETAKLLADPPDVVRRYLGAVRAGVIG